MTAVLWQTVWRVWKEQENRPVADCLESMKGTREQTCGGLFEESRPVADCLESMKGTREQTCGGLFEESRPVADCLESMKGTREQTCGGLLGKYGRNKRADLWWTAWKVWKEDGSSLVADCLKELKEDDSSLVADCLESMKGTREQSCGGLFERYGRNKTADLWRIV